MAAEEHALTPGEYIIHHLTHLGTGKPKGLVDFSVVNFDSVLISALLGAVCCFLLWRAARKATPGVPGRFQAAVEILFELVENEAKGMVHSAKSRKQPMAPSKAENSTESKLTTEKSTRLRGLPVPRWVRW